MGLGPLGRCLGNVTEWCDEDDTLQSTDCAETGQVCGWVDEESGWGCVGGQTDMTEPQPEVADTPLEELNDAPTEACGSEIEAEVVDLANASRQEDGLDPLECDAEMTLAARLHSQDMCDKGYFSHQSPDGGTPWARMRAQGVRFGAAAENIARGQRTPASVHNSWMNSPGHRANILRRGLRRIGVGFVDCNGGRYWTQVFAD